MSMVTFEVGGKSPYPLAGADGARLLAGGSGLVLLTSMMGWTDTEVSGMSAQRTARVHALTHGRLLVMAWEFAGGVVFDTLTDVGVEARSTRDGIALWLEEEGRFAVTVVAVERRDNRIVHLRLSSLPGNVSDVARSALLGQVKEPVSLSDYRAAHQAAINAFPSTQAIIDRASASGKLGS